jgi:hypothetical protein
MVPGNGLDDEIPSLGATKYTFSGLELAEDPKLTRMLRVLPEKFTDEKDGVLGLVADVTVTAFCIVGEVAFANLLSGVVTSAGAPEVIVSEAKYARIGE